MSGTLIEKTTYDLGLAVAANVATCGLPIEAQEYYLQNKNLIPEAICRGFIIPTPEVQPAPAIVAPAIIGIEGWLTKAEEFAEEYFGVKIRLRERFAIPAELPWKSVIPIFDPGNLTNHDAVERALKASGLNVWEEVDVMKYSDSEASKKPTLHFIQNSVRPDEDTMGFSPDQLKATGKNWLSLRSYAMAFGLHHFVTGEYLDPQTWTWFPNTRLSSGRVANGSWLPDDRGVRFRWYLPGCSDSSMGARLAIPVPSIL